MFTLHLRLAVLWVVRVRLMIVQRESLICHQTFVIVLLVGHVALIITTIIMFAFFSTLKGGGTFDVLRLTLLAD